MTKSPSATRSRHLRRRRPEEAGHLNPVRRISRRGPRHAATKPSIFENERACTTLRGAHTIALVATVRANVTIQPDLALQQFLQQLNCERRVSSPKDLDALSLVSRTTSKTMICRIGSYAAHFLVVRRVAILAQNAFHNSLRVARPCSASHCLLLAQAQCRKTRSKSPQ